MHTALESGRFRLDVDDGRLIVACPSWPAFRIGPLTARLQLAGQWRPIASRRAERSPDGFTVTSDFEGIALIQQFRPAERGAVRVTSRLANGLAEPITLSCVELFTLDDKRGGQARTAAAPADARIYEQGGYWARVRSLAQRTVAAAAEAGEPDSSQKPQDFCSQFCWAAYDRAARQAFLAGFESSERWLGSISTSGRPGEFPHGWTVWLDGGDVLVDPGQAAAIEDLLLTAGPDPLELLADYADRVAARHAVRPLPRPPVSWCSWYPYRLGVTEDRMLATARMAAERLKPLGLTIIEADLGWERAQLPSAFEENDQFPHGLKWLSEQLDDLGLQLGAWKAPFTISALDPVVKAHPEWLLGSGAAKPAPLGQWFWEPHGETHALDLTHPGAQQWLRERIRSLAERGVRYFKPDFIGNALNPSLRARHDPRIVAGGGAEAARIGMRIVMEEMRRAAPDALVLNCGCPDMPGTGAFPLLYVCEDTGNSGFVGWPHLAADYGRNLAGHLFKNGRWGVIQPSCLVVGLPGTIEEARLRATATFLSGGQVDVGDDLTTLPEDRWEVLSATLPPLGRTATPIDLFEPIERISLDYVAQCKGGDGARPAEEADPVSRAWTLRVNGGWDEWTLVGLFDYGPADGRPASQITQYRLPLERLGLRTDTPYWTHEFWSGQFLGCSPYERGSPRGYRHPGDRQSLIESSPPGAWDVSFFGPTAKLLVVRPARPHPWVAATSFHQSGGTELSDVTWDGHALRGVLRRPAGQQGRIVIAGHAARPACATVSGHAVAPRAGACGSLMLPVSTTAGETPWEVCW